MRRLATLLIAALPGLILARSTAMPAHAGAPSPPERQIIFAHDLPNVPGDRLTSLIVSYPPGASSAPHHHAASAFTFVYVLSGTVRSQVEGEPLQVYKTGEHWFELPGAHHVVSGNASNTEPASILVVFVARAGDELTVPDH
jgi:quercetin dioxygenase-like cupin family protein